MRFTKKTYRRAHRRAYTRYLTARNREYLTNVPAYPLDRLESHYWLGVCSRISRRAFRERGWEWL